MRSFKLILSLIVTLGSTAAFAEPAAYVRSNGQFVSRGNEYRRGFWVPVVRDAGEVFQSNFEALQEYELHVRDGKWAAGFGWTALAGLLVYTAITVSNDNYDGSVAALIFIAPMIPSGIFGTKSNLHLLRAMNLINGVAPAQARGPSAVRLPLLAWTF